MHRLSSRARSLAVATVLAVSGMAGSAFAQTTPDYMRPIAGNAVSSPADTAAQSVLALNSSMFELYGNAAAIFRQNILAQHPVILALFSGAGGRMILYRPNMAPLDAPQVPKVYQLLKSVAHSTMALAEVVGPYLDNAANQSWRGAMQAYRSRMATALAGLDALDMPADWRDNNRTILQANIAFMDDCLAKGEISSATLEAFARKQAPFLTRNVAWAAQTQVGHWMSVLADWKAMLGDDWDKAYAASNTIYVTRQNNVLFSVLAQFFGPDAVNRRLLLVETISFTTTSEDMLDLLTRIVADRSVGSLFFGNYHLMDYELMGGDARNAIIAETGKRGMKPFLPPLVPFGSTQWPALVTAGPGPASIADLK